MNAKVIVFLLLIVTVVIDTNAQSGWNWPEDKETAQEKNVLYTDNMKNGNYKAALEPLGWLLENAPDLNASIYINGAKIYEELAESEKDPQKKKEFQDKALSMYDKRIEHFNEEANVLDRKAYTAYKYFKDDKEKYEELFQLFEKTFELNGKDVGINNLVAYMDVIRRHNLTGGNLSDEEVLNRYNTITEVIDTYIQKGKNVETLEKHRAFCDKMLTAMVDVDCEFIETKLGPAFEKEPGNLQMAKRIIGLSLSYKCTENPLFTKAAMTVQEQEPTYAIAKVIAIKSDIDEDYESAEKYYKQALELTEDPTKKAEIYYGLANHYRKRGLKSQSREFAFKAANTDPSLKNAYKLVGDLYMTSFEQCKEGVSKVQDRAIFIAAYNMYQKAGSQSMMKAAKEQFPSMEEMFELNMEEGQTVKVGCWVNETVTLQRRPSS